MELAELFSQLLIDLQSVFRKNNKHLSLSLSQVVVLSSIPVDGITMSNLSHRIGVDNSTLTRLIGILEHKGLVERRKNKILALFSTQRPLDGGFHLYLSPFDFPFNYIAN